LGCFNFGSDVEANQCKIPREITGSGLQRITTHQLNIAEELSDRVAIIHKGEIIAEESTEELIQQFLQVQRTCLN